MYFTPVINQAKMGEAIAGVLLAKLFAETGKSVSATQSRFLSWEDLTQTSLFWDITRQISGSIPCSKNSLSA